MVAINNKCKKVCDYCKKCFVRKDLLRHHMLSKHIGYKVQCPICRKDYVSVGVKNRHLRAVHNINNYKKLKITSENDTNSLKTQEVETASFENSFHLDNSFPFMVDALKIKKNATFGKHITASCDIDVGKTVMISSAYASVQYLSSRPDSCFQCGKPTKKIQCQYCINVFFCSKKCATNRIHRNNCDKTFDRNDCKSVRLVTAITDTATKSISDINIFFDFCAGILLNNKKTTNCRPPFFQYGEVRRTCFHEDEHASIAKRVVKPIKRLPQFSSISATKHDRILFCLAYQHTTTINMNTFSEETVLTKGGITTRFSIHGTLSRFNHSCAPNVHHCIDDKSITHCITVRPIKEGDQLFINYLGEMQFNTDKDRQKYLKDLWGFYCKCDKCSMNLFYDELDSSFFTIERHFEEKNLKALQAESIKYLEKYGSRFSKAVEFVVNSLIHVIHNL